MEDCEAKSSALFPVFEILKIETDRVPDLLINWPPDKLNYWLNDWAKTLITDWLI